MAGRQAVMWSIAGFDPSSGAGVTADLQTFAAHGVFGCSAPTAITIQSTRGVRRTEPLPASLLRDVLDELEEDLLAAGVKLGMLGTAELVDVTADFLERVRSHREIVVVLDPVIRASSGAELLDKGGVHLMRERLLPLCDLATPNQAELLTLAQADHGEQGIEPAAKRLAIRYPGLNLIVTGGDATEPNDLVLDANGSSRWLEGKRVPTTSTHGTGCAFSSALLCRLVRGEALLEAARGAKAYVEGALATAPGVGHGRGPLNLHYKLPENLDQG